MLRKVTHGGWRERPSAVLGATFCGLLVLDIKGLGVKGKKDSGFEFTSQVYQQWAALN